MPSKLTEKKEELTKEEAKDLVEMLRYLTDAYGFFALKLGKIQKDHEKAYERMFSLEVAEKMPEMLSRMSEEGPPELGKLFTRIFVKFSTLLPKLGKLMDLSAKEKIKLGKNLQSFAKDFDELLDWIEKLGE